MSKVDLARPHRVLVDRVTGAVQLAQDDDAAAADHDRGVRPWRPLYQPGQPVRVLTFDDAGARERLGEIVDLYLPTRIRAGYVYGVTVREPHVTVYRLYQEAHIRPR